MKCTIYVISTLVVLSVVSYAQANWTTLDYPGAAATWPHGIDGSNIVGYYADDFLTTHGFLYDGSTWTTFDVGGALSTDARGIDGDNIVGSYTAFVYPSLETKGFLYDYVGATWTYLSYPGSEGTLASDIDGSNIAGSYYDDPWVPDYHGFLYDGSNWTTLDYPGAFVTNAHGIDGINIVGYYTDVSFTDHGFLYDGSNWTTLDYPGAVQTYVYGIDGSNIVGYYEDASGTNHGFLYDGSTWTTLDYPGAIETKAFGIDGSNIVGCYVDASETTHGFLYNYDEPPIPDIKANGSDGPLFVPWGKRVNLTISLDPGGKAGERAEWWLILLSFHGNFPLFAFQSPVFELPETSLIDTPFPPGWYIFLFNLDDTPNSRFDLMWYDLVVVVSTTSGSPLEELPDFEALVQEKIEELMTE